MFSLALLSACPLGAMAQEIQGKVVDKRSGEPIIGATVEVAGTANRTVTDIDGRFKFTALAPDRKYSLLVKYISYKTQEIDGVQSMADGAGNQVLIALQSDEQKLGEVTVTAVARRNTEKAMIQQTKASSVIVSNVSAQEIQRTQDSNAGEVIRRVPGVSLIDEKFVMVRGLSQILLFRTISPTNGIQSNQSTRQLCVRQESNALSRFLGRTAKVLQGFPAA